MRPRTSFILCRLVLGGVLLAGIARPAAAQPDAARRHLEAGNAHYEQEAYARAVDAYHRALETGYASVPLYYNLGNAYFRTDRIGRAILYYEKARRFGPAPAQLRHSLDIARRRAEVPPPPGVPGWQSMATSVDSTRTFVLGLIFYLAGLGLLAYRRGRDARRPMRLLHRASLALGLLLIAAALGASYVDTLERRVVVVRDAPLHAIPSTQAARDTTLREGAMLELRRRQPTWVEVHLTNGRTGWLPAQSVEEV